MIRRRPKSLRFKSTNLPRYQRQLWTKCTCGKRGYTSAKRAREAIRSSGDRVRIYRCPESNLMHQTFLTVSDLIEMVEE
jgi:hypothetical protein